MFCFVFHRMDIMYRFLSEHVHVRVVPGGRPIAILEGKLDSKSVPVLGCVCTSDGINHVLVPEEEPAAT